MKRSTPYIIFSLSIIAFLFLLIGDDSYRHLQTLRNSLDQERTHNAELMKEVSHLKQHLVRLRTDPRELEVTARNELGVAKPDEIVFIFEDK